MIYWLLSLVRKRSFDIHRDRLRVHAYVLENGDVHLTGDYGTSDQHQIILHRPWLGRYVVGSDPRRPRVWVVMDLYGRSEDIREYTNLDAAMTATVLRAHNNA